MDELNNTVALHADIRGKYTSLNAQFAAQKQQLHDGGREKDQITKELKSVKSQLNDSNQAVRSAKQNLAQCKTDAENALREEQEKCKKRVDDIQAHLAQVETEMQTQATEANNFHQEVQVKWQQHEDAQKEQVTRLTNAAAASQAECERLRQQLESQIATLPKAPIQRTASGSHAEPPVLGPIVQESQQVSYSRHFGSSSPQSANDHAGDDDLPKFSQFNATQSQPFAIYEDPPPQTYTFKKMPPPNSSVKLVRSGSHASQRSQEGPRRPAAVVQQSPRYTTPDRPVNVSNVLGTVRPTVTSGQSSSPGVALDNPFQSGNNMAMAAPLKRKAESQIVQGYDAQRKKQVLGTPVHHNLRSVSASQPMSRTLEESGLQDHMPNPPPARMRTLGGANARPSRGTKKMSKDEQMKERFARELNPLNK